MISHKSGINGFSHISGINGVLESADEIQVIHIIITIVSKFRFKSYSSSSSRSSQNFDTNGCKHNHFFSKCQHGPLSSLHHLDFCATTKMMNFLQRFKSQCPIATYKNFPQRFKSHCPIATYKYHEHLEHTSILLSKQK